MSKTPVVICVSVPLDGPTLIGSVRALGREGVPVHVIGKEKLSRLRKSRYVRSVDSVNGEIPDEQWKEKIETVLQRIGKTDRKPILLFCTENDLYRFAPMQEYLEERFTMIPSFSEAFRYLEKDTQLPLAEQAGFRVPKSCVLEKTDDLENCVQTLQFPIIVKPLARHTIGVFNEKAMIVDSKGDLSAKVKKYLDSPPTVLIAQEYIPGSDNDILVFMGSSDAEGNVRAFITGRKLRQHPPHHGMMACGYIEPIPALEEKARALCKLYKIRGFIGIECKRPPGTEDYVYIETSFRPEIFNALAEGAGVNLVYDTYQATLGEPRSIPLTAASGSWYNFSYDLESSRDLIRAGEMSWSDYRKRLPRPIAWAYFAWDDPGPFLCIFLEKLFAKIKRWFATNHER